MSEEIQPSIGRQIISSVFIKKEDKFLFVFDKKFKTWRVPGGRSEVNETIEETLIREMKEEVNLTIKDPKFLGYGQDGPFNHKTQMKTSRLIMYFFVEIKDEPIIDEREAEKYKWVSLEEIRNAEDKEGALTDFLNKNKDLKL